MKIVLFDYSFERTKPGITGLSDLVWNWARQLIACGDEVHIVAPYQEGAQPPSGVILHIYPLPPIGYRNVIGHILIMLKGWQVIHKLGRVDLVHAPEYLSTGIFATLSKNIPIVLTVPGNIYERIKNGNPFDWSMTQVLKAAAKASARWCACVIVTSDEMRWWWRKTGTPDSRMVLIPYGVDTRLFRPIPEARERLGFSSEKRIILYVGRLSHEKGLMNLLEAIQQVKINLPNIELHLVGDGVFKKTLQQAIQTLKIEGNVVFHGWVDQPELPTYYSAADVTVLPSFSEGMPRTMIETMACGSPFLGTRITGIVDHVQDGKTGFLVEPKDSAGLAQKLGYILNNREHTRVIGLQGMTYVRENLGWDEIVKQVRSQVYFKVVASN